MTRRTPERRTAIRSAVGGSDVTSHRVAARPPVRTMTRWSRPDPGAARRPGAAAPGPPGTARGPRFASRGGRGLTVGTGGARRGRLPAGLVFRPRWAGRRDRTGRRARFLGRSSSPVGDAAAAEPRDGVSAAGTPAPLEPRRCSGRVGPLRRRSRGGRAGVAVPTARAQPPPRPPGRRSAPQAASPGTAIAARRPRVARYAPTPPTVVTARIVAWTRRARAKAGSAGTPTAPAIATAASSNVPT